MLLTEKIEQEREIFCFNVKWLRKQSGLSQKEMAHRLGIGVKSLAAVENGTIPRRMTIKIFFKIYDHFGVHPKDQLGKRLDEAILKETHTAFHA